MSTQGDAHTGAHTRRRQEHVLPKVLAAGLLLLAPLGRVSAEPARDCQVRDFPIHQTVHKEDSLDLRVPPGYVDSVAVRWDDAIGKGHNARGEVFLDGQPLGNTDIKSAGNTSVFRADRYASRGRVTVRIRRDDAHVHSVKVVLCADSSRDGRGAEESVAPLAEELVHRTRRLHRDAEREAQGSRRWRAVRDLEALEASAEDFYRLAAGVPPAGREAHRAYRRLEDDYRRAGSTLDQADFSRRVEAQWADLAPIMRRLDERFDRERPPERSREGRPWEGRD